MGPLLVEHSQPVADWRWQTLVGDYPDGLAHKNFALVCKDRVEGFVIVGRERQMRSPAAPTFGAYMEYLASAPWNRRGANGGALVSGRGRVTTSGQVLVARAALLSIEEGHEGWLGWNSLPGETLKWYRNLLPGV